jgi:xanthine dehydrogenase YagS FAD-binding subunit
MKQFLFYNPTSLDDAATYLTNHTGSVAFAGGTDVMHMLKQNCMPTNPTALVNLKAIPNLDTITESGGMLKIGPNAKLAAIANSATVSGSYRALAQAAGKVGAPVLRNMGTIAGNIAQDVWCWYYRGTDVVYNCVRKGGAVCFAQAGDNRWYHSIYGGPKGCYAICPSDTAIALSALNASVVTTKRTITMDNFFVESAPGNTLAAGELIKEIDVPTPAAGSKSAFVKFAIRDSIDFSLASAAVWYTPASGAITDCRIYMGGIYQKPKRATAAESYLKGKTIAADVAAATGQNATSDAVPMTGNAYKKALAASLVAKALLA